MGDKPVQPPARPVMTLQRYRALASSLPMPTRDQIEAYVAYLCNAHSWYKHLPILPPGRPCHIYLDPGAGMTRKVRTDGHFGVISRTNEERFHHSWLSTEETRLRFGFLAFAVRYPREVLEPHDMPSLLDPDLGIDVHLPKEARDAGRVDVSGLIHPLGTDPYLILWQEPHRPAVWSHKSGGQRRAAQVLERCRELAERRATALPAPEGVELDDRTPWALKGGDWTLYQLLAGERQRQHDALVEAAFKAVVFATRA